MPLELVPADSGTHSTQAGQIGHGQLELQNPMLHNISGGSDLQNKCENHHLLSRSEIAGGPTVFLAEQEHQLGNELDPEEHEHKSS